MKGRGGGGESNIFMTKQSDPNTATASEGLAAEEEEEGRGKSSYSHRQVDTRQLNSAAIQFQHP